MFHKHWSTFLQMKFVLVEPVCLQLILSPFIFSAFLTSSNLVNSTAGDATSPTALLKDPVPELTASKSNRHGFSPWTIFFRSYLEKPALPSHLYIVTSTRPTIYFKYDRYYAGWEQNLLKACSPQSCPKKLVLWAP